MPSRTHLYDLLVSTIFTEGLDDDMDLWALGFSATWIKGADLAALGFDPATRAPCHLHEILDRAIDDGSSWVAEVDGWMGVVPGHDGDGTLRAISEGGHEVLGLCMYISGRERFTYAPDGRVLVAFDPLWPDERSGDDPHVLDHLMQGLRFELSIDDPAISWGRRRASARPWR